MLSKSSQPSSCLIRWQIPGAVKPSAFCNADLPRTSAMTVLVELLPRSADAVVFRSPRVSKDSLVSQNQTKPTFSPATRKRQHRFPDWRGDSKLHQQHLSSFNGVAGSSLDLKASGVTIFSNSLTGSASTWPDLIGSIVTSVACSRQRRRCRHRTGPPRLMEGPLCIGPSVHALRHSWTLESNQQLSTPFQNSFISDQQLWLPVSFPMPPTNRPTSLPASLFHLPSHDSNSADASFQPQIRGRGARLEKIAEFHDESSEYDTDSGSTDGQESFFSESSDGTLSMPVRPLPSSASLEALTMLESEQGAMAGRPLSDTLWEGAMKQVADILYHPLILSVATASLSQLAFQALIADQVFVLQELVTMLGRQQQLRGEIVAFTKLQSDVQALIQLQAEPSLGAKAIASTFSDIHGSARPLASAVAILKVRTWTASNLAKARGVAETDCIFDKYVAAWVAPDVQDAVAGLEAHLNTYSSNAVAPDVLSIEDAFSRALSLEFDLLTATQTLYGSALHPIPAPFSCDPAAGVVPVVFATDFDVTCTLQDSSETLMHLAATAEAERAERQCRQSGGSTEECAAAWEEGAMGLRTAWDHVLERYSKNLQALIQDILTPPGAERRSESTPTSMAISLPESSSLGFKAPDDMPISDAAPLMQIDLPSPSASSEPSESPRFLPQAASQPNLRSLDIGSGASIPRSPSEPSKLGEKLKAPSRAFDIDSGAAVPCVVNENMPFNPEGLRVALERLGALEQSTNSEVEAAGVLRGMTAEQVLEAAAREVKVRPHVGTLLTRVQRETGQPIHALSANWSADLIKGALAAAIGTAGGQREALLVHSNDLAFDPNGVSTGQMRRAVVSAPDKLRVLDGLMAGTFAADPAFRSRNAPHLPTNAATVRPPFTIYLGDGITDLLALLSADLGIVVGHSFSLRKICAAYGVRLQPLVAASVEMARLTIAQEKGPTRGWSGRWSGVLYETSGWEEVEACVFGSVQH